MTKLAGKTLGKYSLIEQIGSGGFANIYKAYQAHLDRYVAIKVLHPHLVYGEDFLDRFRREAKAVASLRHPNIVIVHDFDFEGDLFYMVMEYIDGPSLQEIIAKLKAQGKYLPLPEVRRLAGGITSALDYAHSQGMLHRDIKPSNVLLNKAGEPFLTDFGIARILSNTQFTATGALIGTPDYMSPEQGQGKRLSPATDVYSLGVMLYELLTGQVPFEADTPLAIIFKHISDPLPPIHTLRPGLPGALEDVISNSLAKDPKDRYQSPGELNQALQGALTQAPPVETVRLVEEPQIFPATRQPPNAERGKFVPEAPISQPVAAGGVKPGAPAATVRLAHDKQVKPWYQSKLLKRGAVVLISLAVLAAVVFGLILPQFEDRLAGGEETGTAKPVQTIKDDGNLPAEKESPGVEEFRKGMLLFHEEQRYRDAIERFDQAEAMGYQDPKLFFNRGWACHEEVVNHDGCSFEQAIQDFTRAIEIDPGQAQFYDYRAWTYVNLDRYDEAFQDYARAIELEPDNPELWSHRAKAFSRIGELEMALENINQAIKLDPGNANYYVVRADFYRRLGEDPGSIEMDLQKAVELDPDNWEAHLALAELYTFELGDIDLGRRHFDLAVERAPKDAPEPFLARGMFYSHIGAWNEAVKDFSLAIRLQPDFPDGYGHRGQSFQQMGRFDEARGDYLTFLELTQGKPEYEDWRREIEGWLAEFP